MRIIRRVRPLPISLPPLLVVLLLPACALLIAPQHAAVAETDYDEFEPHWLFKAPTHELGVFFGAGVAADARPFNLENDRAPRENLAFGVVYYRNLGNVVALGLHTYGYFDTIEDYRAPLEQGDTVSDVDISTTEVGPRLRLTFARGRLFPYVYGGASYFTAKVRTSPYFSEVTLSGYTWFAGAGMGWRVGKNFAISFEGMMTRGKAEYNLRPVEESSDNSFDPTAVYGLILFTWMPGDFDD